MLDLIRLNNIIFIIESLYICYKLFSCTLSIFDFIIIIHTFLYMIWNKIENKNEIYDLLTYIILPFSILYEYLIFYNIDMINKIFRVFELLIIAFSEFLNEIITIFACILSIIIVSILFTYYTVKTFVKNLLNIFGIY